jgi:hypothetical protein
MNWLSRRKLRYKEQPIVPFEQIRDRARTGDIILFHKTTRNGLLEALELDVLSPLIFAETEFRHCGIVIRKNGELYAMECAGELHSGHTEATYLTKGTGIRLVPIETLLEAYNRDNGDPHFGIKYISEEIPTHRLQATLAEYESVNYLKLHKILCIFLSHLLLPRKLYRKIADSLRNEMMCSEFVHSFLNRCGVLKDYPSKLFMPYYIEDSDVFQKLEFVKYSEIVRFRYGGTSVMGAA